MPFGKHVTADQRSSYLTADADAQREQDLRRQGIRKTVPSPRAADGKKEQLLPECDPAHQTGQTQPGRNRRMGVSEEKISRQKRRQLFTSTNTYPTHKNDYPVLKPA
jgi:hypothetical protein